MFCPYLHTLYTGRFKLQDNKLIYLLLNIYGVSNFLIQFWQGVSNLVEEYSQTEETQLILSNYLTWR